MTAAPLCGRDDLVARVLALGATREPGPRTVVLRGPEGSGRSRLLAELAARAPDAGAQALLGRAPRVGSLPLATVADLCARFAAESPAAAVALRRAGPALAALVPALADGETTLPPAGEVAAALGRLLVHAAGRRPVLLLLDDAERIDDASASVLAGALRAAVGLRLLCVLGVEDPPRASSPTAAAFVAAVADEGAATVEQIGGLDVGGIAQLVAAILGGGHVAARLAEALHERTEGLPGRTVALVRALRETGVIRRSGTQWVLDGEPLPPPALATALRSGLPPSGSVEATLVEWLALAGGALDLETVVAVSGLEEAAAATALDAVTALGLAAELPGPAWRLRPPLVADAVRAGIGAGARRLGHRALAGALSARGASAAEIAGHHLAVARPGDREAVAALLAAAAEAEAMSAVDQAVTWSERALALVPAGDDPARLAALDRISEMAPLAGRVDAGLRALEELRTHLAPGDDARRLTLLRREAGLWTAAGESGRAAAAIEAGLRLAAEGGPESALLLADLAMVAELTLPVADSRSIAARASAAAAAAGTSDAAVVARVFEALWLADDGDPDAAAAVALEAGRLAQEGGALIPFGYAVFAHAVADLIRGRYATVVTVLADFADFTETGGLLWPAAWMRHILGQARYLLGDLEGAMTEWLRSEDLGRRHGAVNVMPMPLLGQVTVLAARGAVDEAADRLAEARAILDARPALLIEGWWWCTAARLEAARGRSHAVVVRSREAVEWFRRRGPVAQTPIQAWALLFLAQHGDGEEALAGCDRLLAALAPGAVPTAEALLRGARATALLGLGDPQAALRDADLGAEAARRCDGPLAPALALLVRGEVLAAAGQRGEARDALLAVHATFRDLGFGVEARRAEAALRELGVVPPATLTTSRGTAPAGPLDGLTPREREVAHLAATGLTSRAMAERLSLSERTVENHLQRAYSRLGLHGRADLIALVAGTRAAAPAGG